MARSLAEQLCRKGKDTRITRSLVESLADTHMGNVRHSQQRRIILYHPLQSSS